MRIWGRLREGAITDDMGSVLSEQRYLPFGEGREDVGTIAQTDFGYTGQRALEMGLMDYKARFYDPLLGRFLQPDRIIPNLGNPQSLNRLSYVLNNPSRYTDPTGHWMVETNNPEKELRRNAYIHAAERTAKEYSGHLKEYYLVAAAYYESVATELPKENTEILAAVLENKRDNLRRNGWNDSVDTRSAAGDVALGNAPEFLGPATIGMAGLIWRFGSHHSNTKWNNQLQERGWTIEQINEALQFGETVPAPNRVNPGNPATRYIHPTTGRSVVVDDVTNEILHIGGDDFGY